MISAAVRTEENARSTWERLRSIVAQECGVPDASIVPAITWKMIDPSSARMNDIRDAIEHEFDVLISTAEIYREPNFGKLAEYIDHLLSNNPDCPDDRHFLTSSERRR